MLSNLGFTLLLAWENSCCCYVGLFVLEQARNLTPALSAAAAICDHMRDWLLGTAEGEWTSMGVVSDGSYDVPEGLIFSFPVTCQDGEWQIVQVISMLPPVDSQG